MVSISTLTANFLLHFGTYNKNVQYMAVPPSDAFVSPQVEWKSLKVHSSSNENSCILGFYVLMINDANDLSNSFHFGELHLESIMAFFFPLDICSAKLFKINCSTIF